MSTKEGPNLIFEVKSLLYIIHIYVWTKSGCWLLSPNSTLTNCFLSETHLPLQAYSNFHLSKSYPWLKRLIKSDLNISNAPNKMYVTIDIVTQTIWLMSIVVFVLMFLTLLFSSKNQYKGGYYQLSWKNTQMLWLGQ